MERKRIVVLGAGFGGLRAALLLARGLRRHKLADRYEVVLVDQNPYQTYTPLLTETATAIEETPSERREGAAIDIAATLHGTSVVFANDRVTDVDPINRLVALQRGTPLAYEVLVMALGGEVNYFDIPGLADHARPLKTLADAQALAADLRSRMAAGGSVRVVVGGGGPTGVELVGALSMLRKGAQVTLVEGQPSVLPGFLPSVIKQATSIIKDAGVQILTGMRIARADERVLTLEGGMQIPYDLFIWTGGVKACSLVNRLAIQIDHGRAAVDGNLLCLPPSDNLYLDRNIYAIGDAVCVHDPRNGASVPWIVRAALDQADVAAYNILERLKAQHVPGYIPRPRRYTPRLYPYIIPLGRHHAIAHIGRFTITGEVARLIKWFVELHYVVAILPLGKALRMWWRGGKLTI